MPVHVTGPMPVHVTAPAPVHMTAPAPMLATAAHVHTRRWERRSLVIERCVHGRRLKRNVRISLCTLGVLVELQEVLESEQPAWCKTMRTAHFLKPQVDTAGANNQQRRLWHKSMVAEHDLCCATGVVRVMVADPQALQRCNTPARFFRSAQFGQLIERAFPGVEQQPAAVEHVQVDAAASTVFRGLCRARSEKLDLQLTVASHADTARRGHS